MLLKCLARRIVFVSMHFGSLAVSMFPLKLVMGAKAVFDEHCAGRRKARLNPLNVELVKK